MRKWIFYLGCFQKKGTKESGSLSLWRKIKEKLFKYLTEFENFIAILEGNETLDKDRANNSGRRDQKWLSVNVIKYFLDTHATAK